MTCASCMHFLRDGASLSERDPRDRVGNDTIGVCRRFPPRIFVHPEDGDHDSRWPLVHCAQHCGEHYIGDGGPC